MSERQRTLSINNNEITYRQALRLAVHDCMLADARVVLLGEDIGPAGGTFKLTEGLLEEFGGERVMDMPISETAIVGSAIGLALAGFRPIADLMFADFAAVAWDQIVNEAAKYEYMSAGQLRVPMVIRSTGGAGFRLGAQHSQTTESWYMGIPGLKVVVPASPQDAYSLLVSAIADEGPVVFLEHKALYGERGPVDTAQSVSIGSARIARAGRDVTVVASLAMVRRALQAAEQLSADHIEVEVVDLRSLAPLDCGRVVESVQRTRRLVTVEESPRSGGWAAQIIAEIASTDPSIFQVPPIRVCLPDSPIPFSPTLEDSVIPSIDAVKRAITAVVAGEHVN
jgi:acetoin:2,6-dichlorophenolindophenol oxidoreductase subunit beta